MPKKLLLLFIVSILIGCGGGSGSNGPPSESDWRRDIDFLMRQSEAIHPDLFHAVSRAEYERAAKRLKDDIPRLEFAEIVAGIKRLVALAASREDGHSQVTMFHETGFRLYPLRLYQFADGVYVIDANSPYRHAIGRRVEQIGGKSLTQVNTLLDPLITRDNASTVKYKRTLLYVVPEILEATGVIGNARRGDFLLDDGAGNFSTLQVKPIDIETYRNTLNDTVGLPQRSTPLALSDLVTPFWLQPLVADDALYVKYNWVFPDDGAGYTIRELSDDIAAAAGGVQKVIVDIRHNRGGDATSYAPLLDVLQSAPVNRRGKLYILIGRMTFSAAANFATELALGSNARFVGEATGGSLNNYGDTVSFELPESGLQVLIPTIYWIYAPGDRRISIAPDIPAALTSGDYFGRDDPVLQAALDD